MSLDLDEICWCGHILSVHDISKGICHSCGPCSDGGAKSYKDADRINAKCRIDGCTPYAFYSESWCYEFKPKWQAAKEKKEREDQRERDGTDALTTGSVAFEDWWKREGRGLSKNLAGPDWFKDEFTRIRIKYLAFEAWKSRG